MVRMRTCNGSSIITANSNGNTYKPKEINLVDEIKAKVKMLRKDFKITWITETFFDGCKTDIQVEQRARTAILGR